MTIIPVIVGSPVFRPIKSFLGHSFWVPLSRLSYGAFLSHGMFMQFREFNVERGEWGCGFDAFLFFLAFWTFSFLFSFGMALAFEFPIAALWYEFILKKVDKRDAFYHSQSAKSVYRDKGYQQEIMESKKAKLLDESTESLAKKK